MVRKTVGTEMASDPSDPHLWMFEHEIIRPWDDSGQILKVWWTCRFCKTTVRHSVKVVRAPNSGNLGYDEVVALNRLATLVNGSRASVHPRCSEVRAVREVVES